LWSKALQAQSEVYELYERDLEQTVTKREQSLFHVPQGMRDSVRSAYNDVYDRTQYSLTSGDREDLEYARQEMERLWERAVRTGDRALQHAIGQLGLERGDEQVRGWYLNSSDEKRRAWERYVEAQSKAADFGSREGRLRLAVTGNLGLREPPEIRGI
jgi:hypothetical protein